MTFPGNRSYELLARVEKQSVVTGDFEQAFYDTTSSELGARTCFHLYGEAVSSYSSLLASVPLL